MSMNNLFNSVGKELLDAINYIRELEEFFDIISECGTLEERLKNDTGPIIDKLRAARNKVNLG